MRTWILALALSLSSNCALAASKIVRYAPQPGWVAPPPVATSTPDQQGQAVRFIYLDRQTHIAEKGEENFLAYRVRILSPAGLSLGNISAVWDPNSSDLVIHRLNVIRTGKTTDVLKATKFAVIQREKDLASAVLDGALTATLQVPDLQVGDEVELAYTLRHIDPTFGDWPSGEIQGPISGSLGVFRSRLSWPAAKVVRWAASPDVTMAPVTESGGEKLLEYEIRDPGPVTQTEGAPSRYNIRRNIQFSSFSDWNGVSRVIWPYFDRAATLAAASPLHAEIAKISASSVDPKARVEAALRLVQDKTRYVYVNLAAGNFQPASADDTWDRKFGDCKAKSVLLLAVLRELGISAEPVLVDATGGDKAGLRLPSPTSFNHVVVRAIIDGKSYWLDGTRLNDRNLNLLPEPEFRWALPLRPTQVELEEVTSKPPLYPQISYLVDIDAQRGFDAPAKVRAQETFRGDSALGMKMVISATSKQDADNYLKTYWRSEESWAEPSTVSWRFDESRGVLTLEMTGEGKLDWEGDVQTGRRLDVPHAGFSPPSELRRPKDQDQSAPWTTNYPRYRRWVTIIRLPTADEKWQWQYIAKNVYQRLGGVSYWREASLKDNVFQSAMTRRTYLRELTPAQAQDIEKGLKTFDKRISRVFQVEASRVRGPDERQIKFIQDRAGKDPEKLVQLAGALLVSKRPIEARRIFRNVLSIVPNHTDARIGLAETFVATDDKAGALAALPSLAETNIDIKIRAERAHILGLEGRQSEALHEFLEILKSPGLDDDLIDTLVQSAAGLNRDEKALEVAEQALKIAPDNATAWTWRSAIKVKLGRLDEALADANRALTLLPERSHEFLNRGRILGQLHRVEEAIADAHEAELINPTGLDPVLLRAQIYYENNRPTDALAALADSARSDPTGMIQNQRCWLLALSKRDLEQAEKDCAAAVAAAPRDGKFWDSYALVALQNNKPQLAVERYSIALKFEPKQAPSLYGRGIARIRSGDIAGGHADIAAAKTLSPEAGRTLETAGISP